MNKKAFGAVTLFFLVFFVTLLRTSSSFVEVNQNLTVLSTEIFSAYVVPFELLSLILVGGIIGMLYITGRD